MPLQDLGYDVVIEKGQSDLNDRLHRFLEKKIRKMPYLDVGCNTGWLLEAVPGGMGVDATLTLLQRARKKDLNVAFAWGEHLPFPENVFSTVVLSCILQQCKNPGLVLREALRVGRKVIGAEVYPDSRWGRDSKSPWVKSVSDPEDFREKWHARIERCTEVHWYFEICKG